MTNRKRKGGFNTEFVTDRRWRAQNRMVIKALVEASGKSFQEVTAKSYSMLECSVGVSLSQRLNEMQQDARLAGVSESAVKKLTKIDVIDRNQRLKPVYTRIIADLHKQY